MESDRTLEASGDDANPVDNVEDDLFTRQMELNFDCFAAGHFDAAYHALSAALYLADGAGHEEGLLLVEKAAGEQLAWIEQHALEYFHAMDAPRGNVIKSMFTVLEQSAQIRILHLQHSQATAQPRAEPQG